MKIAIISDIHSNLEALKSVLNDINDKGIDTSYNREEVLNELVDYVIKEINR